jgi:hypothetical protein
MSALEASSAGIKDMADGSLRLTVEFDPRFAKEAFALFGARGTPLAIAALQVGYAQAGAPKPEPQPEKPKGGPLAKLAGMWAADQEFKSWISTCYEDGKDIEPAEYIRNVCGVESRAELDHDAESAVLFHEHIRGPFSKYLIARGIVR